MGGVTITGNPICLSRRRGWESDAAAALLSFAIKSAVATAVACWLALLTGTGKYPNDTWGRAAAQHTVSHTNTPGSAQYYPSVYLVFHLSLPSMPISFYLLVAAVVAVADVVVFDWPTPKRGAVKP